MILSFVVHPFIHPFLHTFLHSFILFKTKNNNEQLAGQAFVMFGDFVNVGFQVMSTRSLVWVLILFVPIAGVAVDICFKVFANMYFPTQTQIHLELEYLERKNRRQQRRKDRRT